MTKIHQLMLSIPLLLLAACSNDETATQSVETAKETLFQEQAEVLEKAKAVEDELLEGIAKGRETMEEQTK